jgi:16S rRNA (uracil1498-N3)-methyltransferase
MARRLRVHHAPLATGPLVLRGEAFAYAAVVHRARIGHEIELFDGEGATAFGAFTTFEADAAHVLVTHLGHTGTSLREVELVQALGKGDKIDESVRDACELGLTRATVVEAARSVRKLDEAGRTKLCARLERIAAEAARQAHAPRVATITGPMALEEALRLERTSGTLRVFFDPTAATPLFDLLREASPLAPLAFAVGPEGGFTAEERALALAHGWTPARFGTTVLRTETMAAAVIGALRAFDDADDRTHG